MAPKAIERFQHIVIYLENNWSEKDAESFKEFVKQVVAQIQQHPLQFKISYRKDIREALITKHNILLYRILNQ